MGVVGIGVDVVDVARFTRVYERFGDRFLRRIFTAGERDFCAKYSRPLMCYAGRFAAKEAVVKALGSGSAQVVLSRDIEIILDGRKPVARLRGTAGQLARESGIMEVLVSISHDAGVAVASAVAIDDK